MVNQQQHLLDFVSFCSIFFPLFLLAVILKGG